MKNLLDLTGKKALVTGGSRGIRPPFGSSSP